MPTFPSIYNNSYVYSRLQSNSIVITTQSGYKDIVAVNNTILICDSNGQWTTDDLSNYATSNDIKQLQDSDTTLLQNITNIQNNLENNYYDTTDANDLFIDNTEFSNSLSNYVLINDYNNTIQNITTSTTDLLTSTNALLTSTSTNLTSINTIQSKNLYTISNTYSNLDQVVNGLSSSLTVASGNYLIVGNISIYIDDITLMTPTDEFISDVDWLSSLPRLQIKLNNNVIIEKIIETNRPLLVISLCDYISLSSSQSDLSFSIVIPNASNINVTTNNIFMYSYFMKFKEVI